MNLVLFLWCFVGWMLAVVVTLALMQMTSNQDREARREEKLLNPFSDVPITQFGNGY